MMVRPAARLAKRRLRPVLGAALLAGGLWLPLSDAAAQTQDAAAVETPQVQQTPAAAAVSTPEAAETLERVVAYLNALTTLRARFVQVSSNGAFAEGDLYVERPGRLRFEYDPPHPALLIANGLNLLYYDRELEQATFLPLRETPLWFLLRKRIDLADNLQVVAVEHSFGRVRVSLRGDDSGTAGQIVLVFADQPIALQSWEILDAQGITTRVALINPEYGVPIDRELFRHDDLNLHIPEPRDR